MKKHLILAISTLFIVPFFGVIKLGVGDVWYSHYIGLFSCFCFGVSLVLWKFNKYISMFLILCWFSTIFGHDGTRIITSQHPRQFLILIQLLFASLAVYTIYRFPVKYRGYLIKAIIALFIVQSILVCLQFLNLDPLYKGIGVFMKEGQADDTVGFAASHNQIGLFYAVTSPIILSVCPYLIPFTLLGLYGSTTSIAWVAFIISNGFYVIVTKKKILSIIVLIMVLLSAAYMLKVDKISSIAFNERFNLVKNTISQVNNGRAVMRQSNVDIFGKVHYNNMIKVATCNPWLGFGIGNFQRISPHTQRHFIKYSQKHTYAHAHNDLVEVYFEMGIVGLILVLLIIIDIVYKFIVTRKTKILIISFTCLLSQFIASLGIFTVHTAMSGMLLIVMLGIFYGEVKDGTDSRMVKRTNA